MGLVGSIFLFKIQQLHKTTPEKGMAKEQGRKQRKAQGRYMVRVLKSTQEGTGKGEKAYKDKPRPSQSMISSFSVYCTAWDYILNMGQKHSEVERRILVIVNQSMQSTRDFIEKLLNCHRQYPNIIFYSLNKYEEIKTRLITEEDKEVLNSMHLVFVIGESRDLLKAFSLFSNVDSPPIFGIGNTQDFSSPMLFHYSFHHAELISRLVFSQHDWSTLNTDKLMKLSLAIDCKKVGEATSQIEIHRGMNQAVAVLNIYIENSCEHETIKIGQFRGDGLLISTPLGSFCKSLSFNGPLMDRTMENIMITPICPLSMKFRPLCLPASTTMIIELDETCRTDEVDVYIDENSQNAKLFKGQFLRIRMSKFKTRVISNLIETSEEFFIRSLKSVLRWGENYEHIDIEKSKVLKRTSSVMSDLD